MKICEANGCKKAVIESKCEYCENHFCDTHYMPPFHNCGDLNIYLKKVLEPQLERVKEPLLEPTLFDINNRIKLPKQVDPLFHEDNLKQAVRCIFEKITKNKLVQAESSIGEGRIDLLIGTLGVECKTGEKLGVKVLDQVEKYNDYETINMMYLAVFERDYYSKMSTIFERALCNRACYIKDKETFEESANRVISSELSYEKFDTPEVKTAWSDAKNSGEWKKRMNEMTEQYDEKLMREFNIGNIIFPGKNDYHTVNKSELLGDYGLIVYNPLGEVLVWKTPIILFTDVKPKDKKSNEEDIKFAVWQYYRKDYIVATEGNLPDGKRSDVTCMPKGQINNYINSKLKIIGIECKSESSYSESGLKTQLNYYIESGYFSHVYLAVPQMLVKRARRFICQRNFSIENDYTNVGILSVDEKGKVTLIKDAVKLDIDAPSFVIYEKRKMVHGPFKERIYRIE